ncbi:MAG: glycosyl transferase family protein, partial [uncultured bacterium]
MKMKTILEVIFKITVITLGLATAAIYFTNLQTLGINYKTSLADIIIILSLILTIHGIFTLTWMLYAWDNPENVDKHKSPKDFSLPRFSFTALIPARHEENVIGDTIKSVNNINYPDNLKEILVLCREDDIKTIAKAEETIKEIGNPRIMLVVFNSLPISKPRSLNQGLWRANNEIIAVFDAEDEPHKGIYNVVNTVLQSGDVDFIQSGVQLMNYRSHWFSTLNVLESFFWYKSALHFF